MTFSEAGESAESRLPTRISTGRGFGVFFYRVFPRLTLGRSELDSCLAVVGQAIQAYCWPIADTRVYENNKFFIG